MYRVEEEHTHPGIDACSRDGGVVATKKRLTHFKNNHQDNLRTRCFMGRSCVRGELKDAFKLGDREDEQMFD